MPRKPLVFAALVAAITLPLATPSAASRVESRDGLSYTVPDGWSVKGFSTYDGSSTLHMGTPETVLAVSRYGKASGPRPAYANKETVPGGHVLTWEYSTIEILGSVFLVGRVELPEAYVEISISNDNQKTRPAQEPGLAAMRKIAETARVLGPRGCVGQDCGPGGVVKPD